MIMIKDERTCIYCIINRNYYVRIVLSFITVNIPNIMAHGLTLSIFSLNVKYH